MTTKKIAFVHPDLGIGGAQQLIVNLCLAALKHNYQPHIYTPYHHQSFPQTHDGTIKVHQHGSFFGLLPATIFGKFKGLLAYIRCLICTLWLIVFKGGEYDLVVADQVSVVLPLLRFFGQKTIFYCHYPDKLLSGKRGFFKRIYRFFIDWVQQLSLLCAHKIYVNSQFTQQVFEEHFSSLQRRGVTTSILYPSIDLKKFDQMLMEDEQVKAIREEVKHPFFFSLNRYQRKKNINLALHAYALLLKIYPKFREGAQRVDLVIAGGYDLKVPQNIQHKKELEQLAWALNIQDNVHFYVAISNEARKYLLRNAECVLYTPQNQHFGIVPCEAMYLGIPIIADNSGGPQESVGPGCGFLCKTETEWAQRMYEVLSGAKKQLNKGRQQVIRKFGFDKFSADFMEGIAEVTGQKQEKDSKNSKESEQSGKSGKKQKRQKSGKSGKHE